MKPAPISLLVLYIHMPTDNGGTSVQDSILPLPTHRFELIKFVSQVQKNMFVPGLNDAQFTMTRYGLTSWAMVISKGKRNDNQR